MDLKNTISVFFILFLFTSCKETVLKSESYYPNKEVYLESDIVVLSIDSLEGKALDFFNEVYDIYYDKKTPVIKIQNNLSKKLIIPGFFDGGLYSKRNVLDVTSDLIVSDTTYHISELKEVLKNHLTNYGKNPKLSDSPDRAIVSIKIDSTESIANLKSRLIDVTQAFDEIENETDENLELILFLDILIPPPPFLEIPQGTFKYESYFAEFGGRMNNATCDVEIKGNKIKVLQDGSTNLTGGKVLFEGLLIKHKSGVWILAENESDKNAEEVGGCTEFTIIYFDSKLIEFC